MANVQARTQSGHDKTDREKAAAATAGASITFEGSASQVKASRARCEREYEIDPHSRLVCNRYSQSEVGLRLEKVEEPLARAKPLINQVRSVVRNANYCMLIADDECAAVAEFHDTDLARYLKKEGIAVGTFWDESWVGTNGIGTSTADAAAVTVNGEEHYHRNFHKFICSAAPLIDHRGRRYGALNLTGTATTSQTEVVRVSQFVRRAADKFHTYVFRDFFQDHRLVAIADERFNDVDNMSQILAVDDSGCIIGVTNDLLAKLGQQDREDLMGMSLKKLIGLDYEKLLSSEERLHRLEEGALGGRYALNLPPVVSASHRMTGRHSPGSARSHAASKTAAKTGRSKSKPGLSSELDFLAGTDGRMQKHVALCRRMLASINGTGANAEASIPLLLQGETGTGKDTFAKALHAESTRSQKPFVELNCAAIPDSLIDSELFGYAPGTFTGGLKNGKDGYIVAANGGTLFLDEIGDMPLESQTRLLRVLSERMVQPLGAAEPVSVDFALICASHQNLQELVRLGRFREDLYYRVCGAKITLPTLRERTDLLDIANRLLAQIDPEGHVELPDNVLQKLGNYSWPGNIRQLKSCLQFIVYSCGEGVATEADLPEDLLHPIPFTDTLRQTSNSNYGHANVAAPAMMPSAVGAGMAAANSAPVPISRRDELLGALHETRWCVAKAARLVGVSRATVHRQMKKYGIVRPDHQGL